MGNQFLHLPVTLHTRRHCFLNYPGRGEGVSYAYDLGNVESVIETF